MSGGGAGSDGDTPMMRQQWAFICANDGTWTYRSADGCVSGRFSSFDIANEDAVQHGFLPFTQYWTITLDGRTVHYRPGKEIVNLKAGEKPLD
jgi:hypothetical protein